MFALVCWFPGAREPVLGVRVAGQWFAWVPGFQVLVFFALGGWRIGAGLVNPIFKETDLYRVKLVLKQ